MSMGAFPNTNGTIMTGVVTVKNQGGAIGHPKMNPKLSNDKLAKRIAEVQKQVKATGGAKATMHLEQTDEQKTYHDCTHWQISQDPNVPTETGLIDTDIQVAGKPGAYYQKCAVCGRPVYIPADTDDVAYACAVVSGMCGLANTSFAAAVGGGEPGERAADVLNFVGDIVATMPDTYEASLSMFATSQGLMTTTTPQYQTIGANGMPTVNTGAIVNGWMANGGVIGAPTNFQQQQAQMLGGGNILYSNNAPQQAPQSVGGGVKGNF